MAAPSYTTDLTLITECESNSGWSEISGFSGGGADATETDYFIQNSACVSQSTGVNTNCGITFDYGSDLSGSITTGKVIFAWQIFLAPNAINVWASGGVRFVVGSANGDMKCWNSVGSDFAKYPYGGWQNTAFDPTFTADQTIGTPGTAYQWFGTLCNLASAVSKGNPHGIDVMRYGRGELIIELGDLANGYGTFLGVATQNDSQNNRWGLLQADGTGYLWKGLQSYGNATNACDFRDANVAITIDDTPRTYATFNKVEFNNASSRVDWTAVSFSALNPSQLSRGNFEMIDNIDLNWDGCTFTDVNTFIFQSNATVLNTIFRRCAQVNVAGGTFTSCTFDNSTATSAVLAATTAQAALISDTIFNSDGTGHAIEISGTAGDFTLTNVSFSDYASSDGSTGNEAVYINIASGTVNLTISGGDSPSIRTAGATVNVIANAVPLAITVLDETDSSPIEGAAVTVKVANATGPYPYQESVSITQTGGTATVTHTGHGLSTNQKVEIKGANENNYNRIKTITVTDANTYTYSIDSGTVSPATGTITSTAIIIDGETNASGVISDTRVYSSNQPVSGLVQRGTKQPIYKARNYVSTIDKDTGTSSPVLLTKD